MAGCKRGKLIIRPEGAKYKRFSYWMVRLELPTTSRGTSETRLERESACSQSEHPRGGWVSMQKPMRDDRKTSTRSCEFDIGEMPC